MKYDVVLEIKDEILNGDPSYDIKDSNGNVLYKNCTIEMVTEILQAGTPLNKALFDKIQGVIDYINGKERGETMFNFYNTGNIGNFAYTGTNFDI